MQVQRGAGSCKNRLCASNASGTVLPSCWDRSYMFFRVWIFFFHLRHDYYCWKPVLGGADEFLFLRALQRGLNHFVRNRILRADPRNRLGPRPKSLSGCGLETVRPRSFKGFVSAFPACFWSLLFLTVDAHIIQSPEGT